MERVKRWHDAVNNVETTIRPIFYFTRAEGKQLVHGKIDAYFEPLTKRIELFPDI